jgi:hypothetical protein
MAELGRGAVFEERSADDECEPEERTLALAFSLGHAPAA